MAAPTMRDVARSAGVSVKTVSRVVNGETTVAPDLAARVRAAVETLHYRPHLGATMLRRNDRRTRTIGVLLKDVSHPFSAAVHRAVEDEAHDHGVHMLTGSLDEDPQRERDLARAFAQRQADGLIVAPAGPDQQHLGSIGDLPIVFVDRPGIGFAADSVLATDVAGASEAVRHLLAHGHRRIAYLGDHGHRRHEGYRAALAEAGLHPVEGPGAVAALLSGADPPTAFFSGQSLVTIDAVRQLRRLGRQHEVALVGFDDFLLADLLDPAVTVVAQDPVAMGRTAARALFERIEGFAGLPREFLIPTRLIARGSGELRPRR